MNGKSPICDSDLLEALAASFEPRFPVSAVTASTSPGVRFLLDRGILSTGHESTVLCDRCEEYCELPIETNGEQRFFICPTGYVERPVSVSEGEVGVYRFDFSAFCQHLVKQNALTSWTDHDVLGPSCYPIARGRRASKRVAVVYILRLDANETATTLPALKSRIQCDKLIAIAPVTENLGKLDIDALAAHDVSLVSLAEFFAKQTFDLTLAEAEETGSPSDSYCKAITHDGRAFLDQRQYEELLGRSSSFDMFIDGFQKKVWKRSVDGKVNAEKLTPAELQVLLSYVEHRKVAKPARFSSSIKVFETARRKADVRVGRYEWRAFGTHRTPADAKMKEYQFCPPCDLRFCITIPLS